MQRLETAELVRILAAEERKLQFVAEEAEKKRERTQELHEDLSRQEAKLAATMEGVGALFSLLNTALEDPSFAREPEAAVEAQTALESEALRGTDFSGGKKRPRRRRRPGGGGLQSAAARVRATPHRNRTDDEKRWVALDAVANPQLYHHVTLAEAEEMRWDALYYTRLDREDVLRVLSLPPQVQLALPFLHTPVEVDAHELLARYSHDIDADHFARLDKGSQDACERMTAASSTGGGSTEAASAGAGDGSAGEDGRSTKFGSAKGTAAAAAAASDVPGATRRVLACMRRAFEANLKIPAEQDDEEAVWCVLDKKLREDLYRDSDEAAADRAEEMCREADAREDARHTWLAESGDLNGGSTAGGAANSSEFARAAGSPIIGGVVQKKCAAEEVTAAKKVLEDREALVSGVTTFFSEDDVKALAAAAVGGSLAGGPPESGSVTTAAVGNGEGARGHKENRKSVTSSGGVDDGVEAFALAPAERKGEKHVETLSQQKGLEPGGGGSGGGGGIDGDEASKGEEVEESKRELAQERRRLAEMVQNVLPLFLVSEEETPLGRDMTRSLAMMQEVALRLGRGQRNVFSGLNPQSAMAILQSHQPLATLASSAAQDPSRATAPASIPPVGTREAGEGGLLGAAAAAVAAAADNERRKESTFMDIAAAALPVAGAEAPTRSCLEAKALRSDETMASSADSGTDAKHRLADETSSTSESCPWGDKRGRGSSGSNANVGDCSTVSDITQKLDKVYGSWEEVHPAALGTGSQEKKFVAGDGGGEHPASFRKGGASIKGIQTYSFVPSALFCFLGNDAAKHRWHHALCPVFFICVRSGGMK